MRRLLIGILIYLLSWSIKAQAPIAFSYQGMAMNNDGSPISNQMLGIKITIKTDVDTIPPLYVERHEVVSSETGHFTLSVGRGAYIEGSSFSLSAIAILPDRYFLSVAIDKDGGSDYAFVGASELLSVPYALHAYSAMNKPGPRGPHGLIGETGEPGPPGIRPPDACCFGDSTKGEKGDPGPEGLEGAMGKQGLSGLETLELTDVPPATPKNGQIYLDNGVNRSDGTPGFRYFDEDKWIDL